MSLHRSVERLVHPAHVGLADLLGELEDPNLQWHVTVVLVQTLDAIPHGPSITEAIP
jgi:hypothetical protein